MSARFTPGPWRVHVEPDFSIHRTPAVYVCGQEDWPNGQLARINTMDGLGEKEANASLIAAAPDLYEALSDLLASAGPEAEAKAHAALAKAGSE